MGFLGEIIFRAVSLGIIILAMRDWLGKVTAAILT
jgi:hypothetical protein